MGNGGVSVRNAAKDIRIAFEQRRISKQERIRLYAVYNPHVDSALFVKEAEKLFPRLNCGLTSAYLQKHLGGDIVQGEYEGNNHTFLLLNRRTIVDITADQYGGPKVYVGEIRTPWKTSI